MHGMSSLEQFRAPRRRVTCGRLAGLVAAVALVAACAGADAVTGPGPVPTGTWGGPQGNLVVYADSATVDMPCAVARITGPLTTTADGSFAASGLWAPQVGPVRIGGPDWQLARFTGHRDGNLLQVNVQVTGGGSIGPLDFKRGVVGTFPRCL